jgi:hypothetical protein
LLWPALSWSSEVEQFASPAVVDVDVDDEVELLDEVDVVLDELLGELLQAAKRRPSPVTRPIRASLADRML